MISDKINLKILEESSDKIKLKFPSVEVPVYVSKRYFKKIKTDDRFLISKSNQSISY